MTWDRASPKRSATQSTVSGFFRLPTASGFVEQNHLLGLVAWASTYKTFILYIAFTGFYDRWKDTYEMNNYSVFSHAQTPIVMPVKIDRKPAHPTITAEQISDLVDQFYTDIRANDQLGPIFARHLDGKWDQHLAKMKAFWRSVLLKTGEYKGKPVPAHVKLKEVKTDDFFLWLKMFDATVSEVFHPDARPIVIEAAERIASSLWLAMNKDPFATHPSGPIARPE